MADLEFALHPEQARIYNSPARFKVAAAGRQSGKTTVAIAVAISQSLAEVSVGGVPLDETFEVGYIFPTFEHAKKIVWPRFKAALRPLGDAVQIFENTGLIVFPNGCRLRLWGADNPDSIRGPTFRYVVLDEFKDMAPDLFDEVVRPALTVARGGALFIGTPKGKNHFYDLYKYAQESGDPEWEAFTFTSAANPAISQSEILSMTRKMSSQIIRQEIEASFISQGGAYFNPDKFPISAIEPADGDWHIAVDLAGFTTKEGSRGRDLERKDDSAIAVVKAHRKGWWVKEILYGKWDPREAALRIFMAAKAVGSGRVGIEKGALSNAVQPYLTDLMRQYGRWLDLVPLTHGNQKKADRIQWALQGRHEKREIVLNQGPWVSKFLEQASDFPDSRTHDDLIDALAYVDQLATVTYFDESDFSSEYRPQDAILGF